MPGPRGIGPSPQNDNPARGHSRRRPGEDAEAACRAGSKFDDCTGLRWLVARELQDPHPRDQAKITQQSRRPVAIEPDIVLEEGPRVVSATRRLGEPEAAVLTRGSGGT